MSREYIIYAAIMLIGVFISSISQVLLKRAAQVKRESLLKEYTNPFVILAYGLFFGATLLSIFAYRVIPLSLGVILEATGYIYVTIFSITIFKEKLNILKVVALGMIIGGILVYSMLG